MTREHDAQPDPEMEGQVGAWLAETGLSADEADAGLDRLLREFRVTPQVRHRLLRRWLDRDEGAGRHTSSDDHPAGPGLRNRLMLGAVGLTAAVLLAVSVGVMRTEPVPDTRAGVRSVAAADGSGDYTTVQAAVDATEPGGTVTVMPGTYAETVVIDKDLTLAGDGSRDDIIIRAPTGESAVDGWRNEAERPHGLLLSGTAVVVSDLTVEVPTGATGIGSTAGSPLIERVSINRVDPEDADDSDTYYAMGFYGATDPTVRDSDWDSYTAVRHATVLFEGSTISRGGISIDGHGDSVVRGNAFVDDGWLNTTGATVTVVDNDFTGGGASFDIASVVEIRDNTFRDVVAGADGNDVAILLDGRGTRALIIGNTMSNVRNGIELSRGAHADIESNTVAADQIGIAVGWSEDVSIEGNVVKGEGAGIVFVAGADASVTGNTIDVEGRGIAVGSGAAPAISGNDVCGGEVSIHVAEGADPELGENETC